MLVVRRGREPGGPRRAAGQLLEDDERLLPVRLVVVGAVERRAPVVHRVEEQVLEEDPAAARETRPWYETRGSAPQTRRT